LELGNAAIEHATLEMEPEIPTIWEKSENHFHFYLWFERNIFRTQIKLMAYRPPKNGIYLARFTGCYVDAARYIGRTKPNGCKETLPP